MQQIDHLNAYDFKDTYGCTPKRVETGVTGREDKVFTFDTLILKLQTDKSGVSSPHFLNEEEREERERDLMEVNRI